MSDPARELARLRALCPGAELWQEAGAPLVYLPGLQVESAGVLHPVDALLCPRERDSYETRLFLSVQLPKAINWTLAIVMARTWHVASWRGIAADQPWLDILGAHLEAVK